MQVHPCDSPDKSIHAGEHANVNRVSAITLSDPRVHGSLPTNLQAMIDPILARPEDQWDELDKVIVAHVYSWALCHLS